MEVAVYDLVQAADAAALPMTRMGTEGISSQTPNFGFATFLKRWSTILTFIERREQHQATEN